MTKGKARSKKKASTPTSTVADDSLPKCLVPGRNMLSTEPGALTWLHLDNLECRQLCRLFDATEVAQMEDRMIMSIAREAAPYFRDFRDRFSETTAELEMFLWSVVAAATPLSKRFPTRSRSTLPSSPPKTTHTLSTNFTAPRCSGFVLRANVVT
ncbi:hypothetical protein B0H14DRAFT_3514153 [Mycena olivaceomarginata]|nr:hypothetical protein B0H14DRAFT_3514153 [Mycena olivaceomarginata]